MGEKKSQQGTMSYSLHDLKFGSIKIVVIPGVDWRSWDRIVHSDVYSLRGGDRSDLRRWTIRELNSAQWLESEALGREGAVMTAVSITW